MADKITWSNETRRLGDLQPWTRNPRQIKKDQATRLQDSFEQFGQVETIAVGPGNEVYNGHQRLSVLMEQHGADYIVDVRVSSRLLTEKEREKLTVYLHKGAAGEWNFDVLANEFEFDELIDWGFKPHELGFGSEVAQPEELWEGMPEYKSDDLEGIALRVRFANEEHRAEFFHLIGQRFTDKTISIWYPERPEELRDQHGKSMVYSSEP